MIYIKLFFEFFMIGAFTFGGGYAMIPLIQDAVLTNGWLSEEQLVNFIAVSESTPGPLAVNMSTFVGTRTAGFAGALVSTLAIVLPSFVIILLIAKCYKKFEDSRIVKGAMSGLRPTIVALILTAFLSIAGSVFNFEELLTKDNIICMMIVLLCVILAYKKVHPIFIIAVSAGVGILLGFLVPM